MHDLNHQFLEQNPSPIVCVDLSGKLIYLNKSAKKLLASQSWSESEFRKVLPPKYGDINQNCKDAEIGIPVTRMEFSNKVILWTPFFNSDKTEVLYSGVDITRMQRNEIALIHAKEKAEEGERLKAAFLDNMSHEIRTPLNSLLGFMNILHEELNQSLNEDQRFYFKLISENGFRLERTMREILDISHFGSGSYELNLQQFDIARRIRGIAESYTQQIRDKELDLEMIMPEGNMLFLTDLYCLDQAVTHLVDNAVKYTDAGKIFISLTPKEEGAELIIRDTGKGIPEALQRQIFVPFSQGSAGHSKQYQGIGLGLSLVRAYLDAISARIDLESAPDQGCQYTIFIPQQ